MADSTTKAQSRGWQGAVLKLLGADDYEITVTGSEMVTDHYIRVFCTGGGLLADKPVHPTMWIRIWFENVHGKLHQRGYTLVDPDAKNDTFALEFAIHDGAATRWAQAAEVGDTIAVTFMGSKFALPDPAPAGWVIVGDPAALPAINSLLDAISVAEASPAPATVWFEYAHDDDKRLPLRVREQDTVHWVRREGDGAAIATAIKEAAFDAAGHYGWVALDSKTTRAVTATLKNDYRIGRKSLKSQAYWAAGADPS